MRSFFDPPARRVVRVLVEDVPVHLAQPLDYAVPDGLDPSVGDLVEIPLSGSRRRGWVIQVDAPQSFVGDLQPIASVITSHPLLTNQQLQAMGRVARIRVGTCQSLIRSAVPPRHVGASRDFFEGLAGLIPGPVGDEPAEADGVAYEHGPAFLGRLDSGSPRAVWRYLARGAVFDLDFVARAVRRVRGGGRSAVVVVPTVADVQRVSQALSQFNPVVSTQDMSARARYSAYLRARFGPPGVFVGTRSAVWLPAEQLGLLAVLGVGQSSLVSQRAPYVPAWEVAAVRSQIEDAALLLGSDMMDPWMTRLSDTGFAHQIVPGRQTLRALAPAVDVGPRERDLVDSVRVPSHVHRTISRALESGPVLVSVPRSGYVPVLACDTCRAKAVCVRCGGNLQRLASGDVGCTMCGALVPRFECPECGGNALRSVRVGVARTAEEFGRAFPRVPVVMSSGQNRLYQVHDSPRICVATVGAEPVADGGFAAAAVLDPQVSLSLPFLDATESALRAWFRVCSCVRVGGVVAVGGALPVDVEQALVRQDPSSWVRQELEARAELQMAPAAWMAAVSGSPGAVARVSERMEQVEGARLLGPLPLEGFAAARTQRLLAMMEPSRLIVSGSWSDSPDLADALAAARSSVSSVLGERLLVQVSPRSLV